GCRDRKGAPYTYSCGRYTCRSRNECCSEGCGLCRKRELGVNPRLPRSGEWERKLSTALGEYPKISAPREAAVSRPHGARRTCNAHESESLPFPVVHPHRRRSRSRGGTDGARKEHSSTCPGFRGDPPPSSGPGFRRGREASWPPTLRLQSHKCAPQCTAIRASVCSVNSSGPASPTGRAPPPPKSWTPSPPSCARESRPSCMRQVWTIYLPTPSPTTTTSWTQLSCST